MKYEEATTAADAVSPRFGNMMREYASRREREERRQRMDAAGECYCTTDPGYMCLKHALEFHAEQARLAALPARK